VLALSSVFVYLTFSADFATIFRLSLQILAAIFFAPLSLLRHFPTLLQTKGIFCTFGTERIKELFQKPTIRDAKKARYLLSHHR
jgi:hypothetical protein